MKKIALAALILAGLMLLPSCSGESAKEDIEETVATEETEKITETDALEDNKIDFDFATVDVKEYLLIKMGEEPVVYAEGCDAYVSSKPSVATVDSEGLIVPVSKGVTLIGFVRGDQTEAIALCVFSEDERIDRTVGDPKSVYEVGGTFMHSAPVGEAQYSSTNEDVVDVSSAPVLSFKSTGYACVTCENVSRPFFYSFVIYDRIVEE